MRHLIRSFCILLPILILFSSLRGQSVISQYELEHCEYHTDIYPYQWYDITRGFYGPIFQPALRLSESEFVYMTQPKRGFNIRTLTCFNLLLEPIWETKVRLDHQEEIFHLFRSGDKVMAMSGRYDFNTKFHKISARVFDMATGEEEKQRLLYTNTGKRSLPIGFDFSPDKKTFVIYHFDDFAKNRRIKDYYDYLIGEEQLGFRISNVGKMYYATFDQDCNKLATGSVPINLLMRQRQFVVDCQIDNEGKLYVPAFKFPATLSVTQHDPVSRANRIMSYNNYPDPWMREAPYTAQIPPTVGEPGRVFASFSLRKKLKGRWRTDGFQVVLFDFNKKVVDEKRQVNIKSSFLVEIAKSREEVGMKPQTTFDRHLMKEIIDLPDGSTWMITQKYDRGNVGYTSITPDGPVGRHPSKLEEIILYEFTPEGKVRKGIVIPMVQRASSERELAGRFYNLKVDREDKTVHLITREFSGKKHRHPPRIFYRMIDLTEGFTSDRKLIFDGKRREQYLINAYTLWLNPGVAVMMVLDGDLEKQPDVVSVKLAEN